MWRRDRVPTLTVQADVAAGVLPETVVSALAPDIEAMRKTLPPAYRIAVGGTVEESAKSQASVIAVVPLMLLIMLTVLMVQLRSFQRLFLVLSVAPLGLIGVVAALLPVGPAARLRGDPRHPRAARHDHQERGDPDRSDRSRARPGQGRVRRRRSMQAARASGRSC